MTDEAQLGRSFGSRRVDGVMVMLTTAVGYLVPLVFVVLVRRPWWVRWLAAGLLLTDIGVTALLVLTTPSGVVIR